MGRTTVCSRHLREIEIWFDCRMTLGKRTIQVSQDLTPWSCVLLLQLIFIAALEKPWVWLLLRVIFWVDISSVNEVIMKSSVFCVHPAFMVLCSEQHCKNTSALWCKCKLIYLSCFIPNGKEIQQIKDILEHFLPSQRFMDIYSKWDICSFLFGNSARYMPYPLPPPSNLFNKSWMKDAARIKPCFLDICSLSLNNSLHAWNARIFLWTQTPEPLYSQHCPVYDFLLFWQTNFCSQNISRQLIQFHLLSEKAMC